ncbi:hypothetical protein G7Y89_g2193 [Cudoniella acicularis]|uniref:Heterokaryon incompatibility domain-containing protein n=1 Tax=Cudoniella acicularis TaxID=354080 RepID=A0A8H4RUX1_9HELO|nr:hypothetical protein G7Y89_g2193 [Cudoniella acicularis]
MEIRFFPFSEFVINTVGLFEYSNVNLLLLSIHVCEASDEDIFPDTWAFRPERWMGKDGMERRKYQMAFNKGGQSYIGINLAYVEMFLAVKAMVGWEMALFGTDEGDVRFRFDFHTAFPRKRSKRTIADIVGSYKRVPQLFSRLDLLTGVEVSTKESVMTSLELFKYEALDSQKQELRLLQILPQTEDVSTIQCRLKTVRLSDNTPFVALSYKWGWAEDPCNILIDRRSLPIRQNLWHALNTIRSGEVLVPIIPQQDSTDSNIEIQWVRADGESNHGGNPQLRSTEYFWIDAICIDQNNDQERNYQVNMMSDIFSAANRVLLWLGHESESSNFSIDCIIDACFNPSPINFDPQPNPPSLRPRQENPSAVRTLCNRGYWRRVWIIQELLLAREIIILCDTRLLHWEWLDTASSKLQFPSSANFILNKRAEVLLLRQTAGNTYTRPHFSLTDLMRMVRDFKCTDIRDRVFGMLGLVTKPFEGSLIEADYELSREELFFKTLEYVKEADSEPKDNGQYESFISNLESALRVHMKREWETRDDYERIIFWLVEIGTSENMWLLHTQSLKPSAFFDEESTPHYAILSHVWGKGEISWQDIQGSHKKLQNLAGFIKIKNCCTQAASDGFEYVWIDTCCIDKTNSAELSEAINSMFRWYRNATECYAYLVDVEFHDKFTMSRWFTRGWTLQELIAPFSVVFFGQNWNEIGTKSSLREDIALVTGIPIPVLLNKEVGICVAKIMSWAGKRQTTRVEDMAYCLLGLFDVHMPMIYGEGQKAFIRLQNEILKTSDDHSIFAWTGPGEFDGPLAPSPNAFAECSNMKIKYELNANQYHEYSMTNKGLRIQLCLEAVTDRSVGLGLLRQINLFVAWLNCETENGRVGIFLRKCNPGQFYRHGYSLIAKGVSAGSVHPNNEKGVYFLHLMGDEALVLVYEKTGIRFAFTFGFCDRRIYSDIELCIGDYEEPRDVMTDNPLAESIGCVTYVPPSKLATITEVCMDRIQKNLPDGSTVRSSIRKVIVEGKKCYEVTISIVDPPRSNMDGLPLTRQ